MDRNQVYKVLGCLPCPFFRFFALLCRKIDFLLSNLAFFAKPKEILTKSMVCGWKCRTFYQKFFDFLTSRNAFWAKVPIGKVVQNDLFYWSPIKKNWKKNFREHTSQNFHFQVNLGANVHIMSMFDTIWSTPWSCPVLCHNNAFCW